MLTLSLGFWFVLSLLGVSSPVVFFDLPGVQHFLLELSCVVDR